MVANNLLKFILTGLGGNSGSSSFMSSAYLALSTTPPNKDGTGVTEPPASSGYRRAQLGASSETRYMSTPTEEASTGRYVITNNKEIHFDEATEDWGTITHFAIYTSATGGTMYYYGALSQAVNVTANTVPLLKKNTLEIKLGASEIA